MTPRPLDALIALQGQLIALLAARNAALEVRVGELEERLARLERAASRNSGNSSLPLSLDDQPGRTPPARPERGKGKRRNPGKQLLPTSLFEHPAAELSVDDSAQLCEDRRQHDHIA